MQSLTTRGMREAKKAWEIWSKAQMTSQVQKKLHKLMELVVSFLMELKRSPSNPKKGEEDKPIATSKLSNLVYLS